MAAVCTVKHNSDINRSFHDHGNKLAGLGRRKSSHHQ